MHIKLSTEEISVSVIILSLFNSPGQKGHVRFSHHLASVVVHYLLQKIFCSETIMPHLTKFRHNFHWDI